MEIPQIIGQVLAPTILISACGLILLGLQNKYSAIMDRIRALNEERRKLHALHALSELDAMRKLRMTSIEKQIPKLLHRGKLDRNAILHMYIGVLFFVLTSLFIGFDILSSEAIHLRFLTSVLFMIGLIAVFSSVIHTILEVREAFDIALIEVAEEDTANHTGQEEQV